MLDLLKLDVDNITVRVNGPFAMKHHFIKDLYKMDKIKKWLIAVALMSIVGMLGIAGLIIYVDPFFQYHNKLKLVVKL